MENSLATVLRLGEVTAPANASALEMLEVIGNVDVSSITFGEGMRVGVDIGQYHDARLTIWGEAKTISLAAEACLSKLQKTGLIKATGELIDSVTA